MAKLNTSKIGTIGELIGSAWLAAKGYTVHRNTEPNGPIDLIAEKDGKAFCRAHTHAHNSLVNLVLS